MRLSALALTFCSIAAIASAEELTLDAALSRVRTSSPAVRGAESEVAAARAELSAASRVISENPTLEALAGKRNTPAGQSTNDHTITIDQPLTLGGRRTARIESARAALDVATARRDVLLRDALAGAATAYARAAAASARAKVAYQDEALAKEIERIAQRRFDAGDVAVVDVNATKADAAQARAETLVAEGDRDGALARLRALLGLGADVPLTVDTDLITLLRRGTPRTLDVDTPEVREAAAEVRRARAEAALARARTKPDFGIVAEEAREENSRIFLGGARLTLPIFNRGQAEVRAALARVQRAEALLELTRRQAEGELRAASAEFDRKRAAANLLDEVALPLLIDNERLIARSYEAGEIDLAELLTLRRQTNTIRTTAITRLEEAARAWIELLRRIGAPPLVSTETQP